MLVVFVVPTMLLATTVRVSGLLWRRRGDGRHSEAAGDDAEDEQGADDETAHGWCSSEGRIVVLEIGETIIKHAPPRKVPVEGGGTGRMITAA